jgi:hypothetical protein
MDWGSTTNYIALIEFASRFIPIVITLARRLMSLNIT